MAEVVNYNKFIKDDALRTILTSLKAYIDAADGDLNSKKAADFSLGSGLKWESNRTIALDIDNDVFEVVTALPETNIKNKIYLVADTGSTGEKNAYVEYIYTGNTSSTYDASKWEKVGEFEAGIDWDEALKDYATTDALTKHAEANETKFGTVDKAIEANTKAIGEHTSNSGIHVTTDDKARWDAKTSNEGTVKSVNGTSDSGSHLTLKSDNNTVTPTLTVGLDEGYAIPTSGQITNWDADHTNFSDVKTKAETAYGWGDHSKARYTSNTGTVTSVGLSMPEAFDVKDTPVVSSGTIAVSLKNTYTIPTVEDYNKLKSDAAKGVTAEGWGNHASAGYLTDDDTDGFITGISVTDDQISYTVKGTAGPQNVTGKVNNVAYAKEAGSATTAETAEKLSAAPTFAKGTGNTITLTVGGKTSTEYEIPYSTKSGEAAKVGTATVGSTKQLIYLNAGVPTAGEEIYTKGEIDEKISVISGSIETLSTTEAQELFDSIYKAS